MVFTMDCKCKCHLGETVSADGCCDWSGFKNPITVPNADIIKRFQQIQGVGHIHPYTCGKNSDHGALDAKEIEGNVIMYCPVCEYTQTAMLPIYSEKMVSQHLEAQEQLIKLAKRD